MAKFSVPKATSAARKAGIPLPGELLYDKDEKAMYFGDGATEGGVALHNRSQESAFVYGIDKDIAKLADILGHSNINTTRIYIVSSGIEHRQRMESMHLTL